MVHPTPIRAAPAATARPKAYSYVRFSTPEQATGDSLRRQTEAAQAYAAAHGLEFDEELHYHDHGISAFRGRNAEAGALGQFLEAVRTGTVAQGSYLIVESLDRVSRQTARRASRTMDEIVEAGVNLVDLSDGGRVYNTETLDQDPTAMIMMVLRFMRAHEESALKSRRLSETYANKRAQLESGAVPTRPFTRMLPGWVLWDEEAKRYAVDPERAAIVKEIFAKADEGWGQHRIARWLNDRGIPTWGHQKSKGERWHRSYIKKLLTSLAVVGTFVPHLALKDASGKRVRKPLHPIEDLWPTVVDREVFERVSARTKATAARGRNAERPPASIFAGVLKCPCCGGSVIRVPKGDYTYLVCSKAHAHANGCKCPAVRYEDVEEALRRNIKQIYKHAPRGRNTADIDRELEELDERASLLADDGRALADELIQHPGTFVRQRLIEKEAELKEVREAARELKARRDALAKPYVLARLKALRESLSHRTLNVPEVNKLLKETVSKIVADPSAGRLTIFWRHSEEPTGDIPFFSRHSLAFHTGNGNGKEKASGAPS